MAEMLNVDEVLRELDIKENMQAVEFGCGSADFTIALAKKLRTGKVWALDVQEEKISALKGKLIIERLTNVGTVVCDLEILGGSTLSNESQDIVLIPNVLFQAENKSVMIEEAKRILKPQGQLLIIDWLKKVPFGPKENLLDYDQVKKIAQGLDFSLQKEFAAGDYHYALLFTK